MATIPVFADVIDTATVAQVSRDITKALTQMPPGEAVLDLSRVRFIDSTGIGMLIGIQAERRARGEGTIALAGMSRRLRRTMDLLGLLHEVFVVIETTAAVPAGTISDDAREGSAL